MSIANDIDASSKTAKRPRTTARVSDIGMGNERDETPPADDGSSTASTNGEFTFPAFRNTDPLPLTINSEYVHPPNEPNALKALKGTKLEPLRALLATLPERFITHIAALSRATLDLAQKIKQRDSSASRFNKQVVVLDEHGKAVLDDETGAKKTTDFIPRSVRDKNPVRCSDDVKEDTRIVDVMQRTVTRHELYKKEQAADIHVIADLEITIMKEQLNSLYLEAAFKYAKSIHVMEKKRGTFETTLEINDAAHHVVVAAVRGLPQSETDTLSTSVQTLLDAYTKHHGVDLPELEKTADPPATRVVLRILTPILSISIPQLIKYHREKDLLRDVNNALNEFLDMEDQLEANNDLEEKLDAEDAQQQAMEDLLTRIAEGASKKELQKYKSFLRKKYSASEESHSRSAEKNGQRSRDNGSGRRKEKSKKNSKQPSNPKRASVKPPPPPRGRSRSSSKVRFSRNDERLAGLLDASSSFWDDIL